MTTMTRVVALASALVFLAGCRTPSDEPAQKTLPEIGRTTTTLRRPALHGLVLEEGLNLIDRAPTGANLVARVVGDEITEWQVFDATGPVALAQKKKDDGDLSYCEVCQLTGGTCAIVVGGDGGMGCCWANWGCQVCDFDGENCTIQCDTQECKDANDQSGTPGGGNAPDPGDIATVVPDGAKTFFDAATSRWSVTTPTGQRMHVPSATSTNDCAVCASRPDDNTCWSLPCLPAKTSTYRPALRMNQPSRP